jgi:hypothetical protein
MLGMSLLCVLPVAVGQSAVAENAVDMCRQLVQEAREVERLLRTISDHESGKAAVTELRTRMEFLLKSMEKIGSMPIESAESVRALEQMLRDLTHITQSYLQIVQRLTEVNAYGVEELMAIFQYYKMGAGDVAETPRNFESPLVQAYAEWCDSIDDMLFTLRRVQNDSSAQDAVVELPALLRKVEDKAEQVEKLQAGLSPLQVESERVPMERLQRLRAELRDEVQRIRNAGGYGVSAMQELLSACVRASRG